MAGLALPARSPARGGHQRETLTSVLASLLRGALSWPLRWLRSLSGNGKPVELHNVSAAHTYFLPFVDFGPGDAASGAGINDRIQFASNGAWTLRRPDDSEDQKLIAASAVLATQADYFLKSAAPAVLEISGATLDQAQTDVAADDISWILSLALGQTVSWTRGYYRSQGQHPTFRIRGVYAPFTIGRRPPLANDGAGRLKNYLEAAHGNFVKNREWWQLSIGWWVEMHESNNLHIVGLIGSILLERVSEFYLRGINFTDQIGAGVDAFLDKKNSALLATKLDLLFQAELTPKWESHRSGEIVRQIKQMNNSLSYGAKVKRACAELGVPIPEPDWLRGRNDLAHQGKLNDAIDNLGAYHDGIRRTATQLLLKLLTKPIPTTPSPAT